MNQIPIYIINLKREKRRREFMLEQLRRLEIDATFIDAIDSRAMNTGEIEHLADAGSLKRFPNWLTPGAIACACSHRIAYEDFLSSDASHALILEDDVVLPDNFKELHASIGDVVLKKEVLLLHFLSFKPLTFSKSMAKHFGRITVYPPSDMGAPTTAAAYVVSRDAASAIVNYSKPIKVPADAWGHYYENGVIDGLFCMLESGITTAEFKSSIDYLSNDSLKGKVMQFIDRYKIPIIYGMLARRRKKKADAHRSAYTITE